MVTRKKAAPASTVPAEKKTTKRTRTTAASKTKATESKLEQAIKRFAEVGIDLKKGEDGKFVATVDNAEDNTSWNEVFKTPTEALRWLEGYKGFVEAEKLFAEHGFELYRKEKYLAISFVDKEQIFKTHLEAIDWLNTEWLQQVEESNDVLSDEDYDEVLRAEGIALTQNDSTQNDSTVAQKEPQEIQEEVEEEIVVTPMIPLEEEDMQAVSSEEISKARSLFLEVTIEEAMKADVKPVDTSLGEGSYTWEEIRELLDNQATSVHQLAIAAARKGYGLHFENGKYTLKV
ncbi:hypothetical protein [Brasilonema sp. UFV-L1]|uniref:hypothetical protein n=1 Tax=Brasilonema sp. UFV-L1 TaxID=2234130 RepID=UPI00145D83C7|nr:hypothetical protein [Brasilonema sp. UFV-L1]NMG11869.1 hypothetical protein [Brasilonema sp. UFV-L1]